jgi:outer membrane autotransporter protein
VTSGYEYRPGNLLASPYARVNASWSTLDAFTESGGGVFALQYGTQTVNSFTGGFGLRAAYKLAQAWGAITPRMRIEYAHEFAGASIATVAYADLVGAGGSTYALPITQTGSDFVTTGLGVDFNFIDSWILSLDYRTAFGQEKTSPQMLQMKLMTKF